MNKLDVKPLPVRPDIDQYRKQARELLRSVRENDPVSKSRIEGYHPRGPALVKSMSQFALADAQVVIAREHGIASWPKLVSFISRLSDRQTLESSFETAADAIVEGEEGVLRDLLLRDPLLVRKRSERAHRCTLLHYVGANGFENYRQKTPPNAVTILELLLTSGAEVDALAETYGRVTTLGLVATSSHPARAGLQIRLMESLVLAGADINGPEATDAIPLACLRNGHLHAAQYLAEQGAKLDLETAAGLGRIDLVRRLVPADLGGADVDERRQAENGFLWACQFGHRDVVESLLEWGVPIATGEGRGMTGLHMAVIGGDLEMVRYLVDRGGSLEAKNQYGGTPMDQAVWCASHSGDRDDHEEIINFLVSVSAKTEK